MKRTEEEKVELHLGPWGLQDLGTLTRPGGTGRLRPAPAGAAQGRNEPCRCRSGRKYKHCCGKG